MEKVKVFIADDSIVARKMLINVLAQDEMFEVAGEAETGQGAIILLGGVEADLLLLKADIEGGIEVTEIVKEVKELHPDIKIVILADARSTKYVIPAAEVGADSFLYKPYRNDLAIRLLRETVEEE